MTTAEVAQALQWSEDTVQQAAGDGRLPALKWGKGWVFPVAALEQRLNELALEEANQRRASKGTPAAVSFGDDATRQRVPSRMPPRLPRLTEAG